MSDYLKSYRVCIKTHSPLYIGSGLEYTKKEYVIQGGTVGIVNLQKLSVLIYKKGLFESYSDFMTGSNKDLYGWLIQNRFTKEEIDSVTDYSFSGNNVNLDKQHGMHLARKAAEMFAALAIEKQYNKEQIFEMYVNTIYFGSGHYGIGEAAQGYFGKTPLQLTDAEAVMLAGLPNAPSAYSPNSSPDLAVKRMQVVLNRMVGCKKLTREQADALAAEAVTLQFLPAS